MLRATDDSLRPRPVRQWIADNLGLALMLSMLALFSSKAHGNIPAAIMALLGFYRLWVAPRGVTHDPCGRLLLALFACLWIPMLLALPDAVNRTRAIQTTIPYLRYLGMGVFVLHECRRPAFWSKLNLGAFVIITFWCIDALIQYFLGHDLFGYPGIPETITGVFYPEIKLGHVTAALSALYFHGIYTYRKRWPWVWCLIVPLVMVIALSGRRAAWIMLAVSMVGYAGYLLRQAGDRKILQRQLAAIGAVLIVATAFTVAGNPSLQYRVKVTLGLFSGDYATVNTATASRLTVWTTATNIIRDHWVNGIGPRGYRFVYTQYSAADDPFHVHGQTHPHQLVLEVLTETGVIGLVGLVLFCVIAARFVRTHRLGNELFPWLLAVITATFPFNTHMAFYGSYWSSMIWWLILVALAGVVEHMTPRPEFSYRRG